MKSSGPWKKAHPGKIDILGENRTLNLETIRESMKKKTAMIVLSIKRRTDRIYLWKYISFCRTIRCGNAFYVFFIAAADKGQFGVTAIYTNQATGRIMEPVLVKGAEGLR